MKRQLFIYICWACMFLSMPVAYADEDCDLSLLEAQQAYNAGDYAKAKSLFEYVVKECGADYGNATAWIERCEEKFAPNLSVSQNSISVSSDGATQYITVTSNVEWSVQYSTGDMYSVTRNGNMLTVRIFPNTSSNSRTDYFNVKTVDGNKEIRINLQQSGKRTSSNNSSVNNNVSTQAQVNEINATIQTVTPEYNVYEDGKKGMRIHVKFSVNNMRGIKGWCVAWFADASHNLLKYSGNSAYTNFNGNILVVDDFTPSYQSWTYSDFKLFIPYEELHRTGKMTFQVEIREASKNKVLATSSWYSFTYNVEKTLSLNKTSIHASANGTTEYITVTSNTEWEIQHPSGGMYSVTRNGNILTVKTYPNSSSINRSDYFYVQTTDGSKRVKVVLNQAAKTSYSNTNLSLSKTSVSADAGGTTQYITVTSNKPWEVQYSSGSMYSVTRNGNILTIKIYKNTSSSSRSDFFNVKTTDGSKVVKVNLSQSASRTATRTKSSSYGNYNRSNRQSALSRFNSLNETFQMQYIGFGANIGTSLGADISFFSFRWSWFGLRPLVGGVKYRLNTDETIFYYQPDVKVYIPWNNSWAVTLAAGPSFELNLYDDTNVGFKTELGITCYALYNFFLRYDGDFVAGISINM